MSLFSIIIREIKNTAHLFLAKLAVFYYGNPSKRIKVIGVTGTDGKTTTSSFIYQLLEFAGKKTALISTVGVFMNEEKQSLGFHVTTPSPFELNKYIKKAVDKKMEYVVIEVSSHALDQYRVYGIDFKVGMITNITKEHLDYHRSMKKYLKAKVKLLKMARNAVLNIEDPYYSKIKEKINSEKISTYSLKNKKGDLHYDEIKNSFTKSLTFYNKKNLMSAVLTLDLLGVDRKDYFSKIKKLELPKGRLEQIQKTPFKVIVDFAHTPNSFSVLLPEIKNKEKRLIHVFGSAGERDKKKRPYMGSLSSEYSDVIILTAEDPRSEKIENINKGIIEGLDNSFKKVSKKEFDDKSIKKVYIEIPDRKEAIKFALNIAQKGDTVAITGKGPEESMNMGKGEIPWNDIEITKKLIKNG